MARGNIAKTNVTEKIKQAFGQNFIGEIDKKLYVYADDGGEKVQIAITLTCPKVAVQTINTKELNYNSGRNFEDDDITIVPSDTAEISEEEKENIRKLMQRMGL